MSYYILVCLNRIYLIVSYDRVNKRSEVTGECVVGILLVRLGVIRDPDRANTIARNELRHDAGRERECIGKNDSLLRSRAGRRNRELRRAITKQIG